VGIHDIDSARLAAVGAELGVPTEGALDHLLDRVDAAVVAVPTVAHEQVALAALERGVDVLIEKPIAPTLAAADRILAAAARSGARVQIGHVERFNGALRASEEYLDEPLFVESHRLAPFGVRGTDVAVVLDLMIHDLDLVLSLNKRPVTELTAVGIPVLTASPDIANARLEFEGGGVANLTASRVSMERMRKLRIFQRSGYLSLDLAAGTGEFLRLRSGVEFSPGEPFPATSLSDLVERISFQGEGPDALSCELESFVSAALGRSPIEVTGEDGRRALAVALEINGRIEKHVIDQGSTRA
jgi:predicted dehydrogenase